MVMCWAYDCNHYSDRGATCKFFRFPMKTAERNRWKRLLRRTTEPGPSCYVCSCHFRDGEKKNGPELFSFNVSRKRAFDAPEIGLKKKGMKKPLPSTSKASEALEEIESMNEPLPSTSRASESLEEIDRSQSIAVTSTETSGSSILEAENYFLKKHVEELEKQIAYMKPRFCYENIQANDKLIALYTGLPNAKIFEALFNLINGIELNYYMWTVQKLNKCDMLLLTLMKLRLNAPHLDLAERFAVSQSTVSNICITYIHVLYEILFEQFMADMPTRHKNKMCLPNCFSAFTDCRIVIDCTEIFTAVSRKSMAIQRATYSHYKHHNTFKGLIGVAPNGVIIYVSDLYSGSTSDKQIVKDCGLLNKLEVGDLILADKGFLIHDILPPGVNLNTPPFLRTPQFTPAQIQQTKSIARARIHVERAIRRIKCFRILHYMPESLSHYGDVIFKTIAAITNLQYPLMKEIEELFV